MLSECFKEKQQAGGQFLMSSRHPTMGSTTDSARVLVGIATYRRAEGLATLLSSLASQEEPHPLFDVVVVDNDSLGSAREVVHHHFPRALYVREPEPGIAAARNAVLKNSEGYDFLLFVDDDEFVSPTWIETLVGHAISRDCDVVVGPVISLFRRDRKSVV